MKKAVKILALVLVLSLFALMALGSGSSKSENKGAETYTSVSTKEESKEETNKDEIKKEESKETVLYEVGDPDVVVYKNSIGTTWVQISVPIKNTGSVNLYLSSGTMDLEDANGHLVESMSLVSVYPQVIKPGETAWYYEETTLDEEPASELSLIPHVDVKKATVDCIRYEVSDLTLSDDTYGGLKLTGRASNTTEEDESMPYVVAFFYDGDGKLLGSAFTIMDNLKTGDKMGFSMTTFGSNPAFKTENVSRYEVISYPMQFQFN